MTDETGNSNTGKAWKGLLASIVFSGAGQFFSGAHRRGIIWALMMFAGPLCSLLLYNLQFVPAKAGLLLLCAWPIAWLVMLHDAYRQGVKLRWFGWPLLIGASLILSELPSWMAHRLLHAYKMPTISMIPTIVPGDNLLVSRAAYWIHGPERGDLVVFGTSSIPVIPQERPGKEVMYLKRVVGLPGDHIDIGDGRILVNKMEMNFGDPDHPIQYRGRRNHFLQPFDLNTESYAVPAEKYFVLGDNSANSFDSRYWGAIPASAIYGKVTKIYWPWKRISTPR